MPSGVSCASRTELAERVMGDIGAALHVVDAGAEGAVALDLERQAIDEAHRMDGVEMAQNQDARRVLSPGRTRHQVIAASRPCPRCARSCAGRPRWRSATSDASLLTCAGTSVGVSISTQRRMPSRMIRGIEGVLSGHRRAIGELSANVMRSLARARQWEIGRRGEVFSASRPPRARRSVRPDRRCCAEAWRRRCA